MSLQFSAYWTRETIHDDGTLYYRGDASVAKSIVFAASSGNVDDLKDRIIKILRASKNYSSGALISKDIKLAWTDHIRTWPIFYTDKGISDDPDTLPSESADELSALEMIMAGYVTNNQTLRQNVSCLLPGEMIISKGDAFERVKYYTYNPTYDSPLNEKEKIAALGNFIDESIKGIIARAEGRQIWLPLSGGLDSRILLCKLHEHGARAQLRTFSYGPKNNFEALRAKRFAATLDVSWQMVSPPKDYLYKKFNSQHRKDFWQYASKKKAVPCMREYGAFCYLRDNNIMPADAVIINGQSGDYITGGHVPKKWCHDGHDTIDSFYKIIIEKHYGLWLDMMTDKNLQAIKKKINETLGGELPQEAPNSFWAHIHEVWEYETRQISYVVNGQRLYEYLGLDWVLPLWEKELVDQCEGWTLEDKVGQNLYRKYLCAYNYHGLFPVDEGYIWRWPLQSLWAVPLAQIVGITKGRKAKEHFYSYMKKFGHYSNQYDFFDGTVHAARFRDMRSIISLHALTLCQEQSAFPECYLPEGARKA